jgi:hypothetical protein
MPDESQLFTAAPPTPAVTPADRWIGSKYAGMPVTLPSGNVARLRRTFSMIKAIEKNAVPNPLKRIVNDAIKRAGEGPWSVDFSEVSEEEVANFIDLINEEVLTIFVEPQLVVKPSDEELKEQGIDPDEWHPPEGCLDRADVSFQDRSFAYSFAQGAAADLTRFRDSEADVASAQHGQGVRDESVSASGDQEPMGAVVSG